MTFLFEPTPAADVAAFIRGKAALTRTQFEQVLPELRALSFTVAGVTAANALQDLRDTAATLPEGALWKDTQKALAQKLGNYLPQPPADLFSETPDENKDRMAKLDRQAGFILRQNGNQAYAVVREKELEASKDAFPFAKYLTVGDDHVRDSHAALEGVTLPMDDPFWDHHTPPWEFGCRCEKVPVTAREYGLQQDADKDKPAEERQTLNPEQEAQLKNERSLWRNIAGVPTKVDLRAPIEKPHDTASVYVFNPKQFQIPLDSLKERYHPEVWDGFVKFAKNTQVDGVGSLWKWLNKKLPKPPKAKILPEPTPAPEWPESPDQLTHVKSLGGSTGAVLAKDADGKQFVQKRGNSPEHLREEDNADALYRVLGVPVPESKLYETSDGPVKLSKFIKGTPLRDYLAAAGPEQREAVLQKIRAHFVADALLGNWDVAGLGNDNIIVDPQGIPHRIDNGGALRFRAQGARKKASEFGSVVNELDSLRDAKINPTAAQIFSALTDAQISSQARDLVERRDQILAAAPEALRDTLSKRLDDLASRFAPPLFPKELPQKVAAARLSGFTHTGDKDLVEDTNILFWEEKDAQGNAVLRAKLRLTQAGSDAIVNTLGEDMKDLAPLAAGRRTLPSDAFWPALEMALKHINFHLDDGKFNAAKLANFEAAAQQLDAFKPASPAEQAMKDQYTQIIAALRAAMTSKKKTAQFEQYEPPAEKVEDRRRRTTLEVKADTMQWKEKTKDKGRATQGGSDVWKQQAYRIGDADASMHFIPWKDASGRTSTAPYAFRGYVELQVPGGSTPENLGKAAKLLRDAGVDIASTPPAFNELVYLQKGLELKSHDLDAAQNAAWRAIAEDAKLDEPAKVQQLKDWITSSLKVKLTPANYQPEGSTNSFGEGWKHWERWDLPRAEIEKKMAGYGLVHGSSRPLADVVQSILEGGGQFTPTMERLRTGVSLKTGGMSSEADMTTGGANYLFTRIRSQAGVDSHHGMVFKIGNLARMDNFSFGGDKFGDVRPPGENTHGIDPRKARARTVAEFKANAKRGSNETIFKQGLPFLDEIQKIRCSSATEREAVLKVFRRHGYSALPDGRSIEEIVTT